MRRLGSEPVLALRKGIAEAGFERIDLPGVTDNTFTLTAHAKVVDETRP